MEITYFFLGIIFLQLFYIATHYSLFRQKEFLYFIFFSLIISSFCFLKIFPNLNPLKDLKGEDVFSSLYGMLFFGVGFYFNFLRIFLDLDKFYPKFMKIIIFFEKILFLVGLLILVLGLFSLQYYSVKIFSFFNLFVPPFFLVTCIYLGTRKRTINRIIMAGTLVLILAGRSLTVYHIFSGEQKMSGINFQLILFAVIIFFLFLNFGLLYKSKLIYLENIQMEVNKQTELNNQRSTISADLHDDLGATLSGIHINASLAKNNLYNNIAQSDKSLTRIIDDLRAVTQNMGDIIWAINPDKQNNKSISGQLKDFYFDLMDDQNIHCNYHIDKNIESQIIDINARKNLLLISKEAINNILKHAHATNIEISLGSEKDQIVLKIQDNGVGMEDPENTFSGNGLKNMKYRAEKIRGILSINSEIGKGTTISCSVPITNIRYTSPLAI
jgi:signal transduction histidine kinase